MSGTEFEQVKEHLVSVGVRALVARDGPRGSVYRDWQEIPGTRLNRIRVLMLQSQSHVLAFPGTQASGTSSAVRRGLLPRVEFILTNWIRKAGWGAVL